MNYSYPTSSDISKRVDLNRGKDSNPETLASFSSLKDHNNAISTKMSDANSSFYKSYQASNGPTPEPDSRKNYRTYPYDYFSGTDAKVFFGDVWVDDIVTIQYSVNQNKIPIYGYASQLYDAIARGTVIVQGSLTIAFKEMGYLNMVQRIMETQREGARKAIENKISELAKKAQGGKLQFIPVLEGTTDKDGNILGLGKVDFAPNGTAQIIRKSETIEDILRLKKGGNSVASGLGAIYFEEENPNGNRDFEDFAEVLEDTVWGDSNGRELGHRLQFRRPDEFDYFYANGKDIGGIRVARDNYSQVLNILITFGDMNDFRAEHTITALNDVHFTSQSTIVAPTGEPIGETYTFFARDINQNISASTFNIPKMKFEVGKDIEISRLKDVQELEKYLNFKEGYSVVDIASVASFTPVGWLTTRQEVITADFNQNSFEPFVDQLIRVVERAINDTTYSKIDVTATQHILEIKLSLGNGKHNDDPLRFVVQQDISETFTYRVISPTRNNYAAVNIMSREDMWGAITSDELARKKEGKAQVEKEQKDRAAKEVTAANTEEENRKKAEEQAQKAFTEQEYKTGENPYPPEWAAGKSAEEIQKLMSVKVPDDNKNAPKLYPGAPMEPASAAALEIQRKSTQATFSLVPPQQAAKVSQGTAGTFSHSGPGYENKAAMDITAITSDDPNVNGKIWIPSSNQATITVGQSSVHVQDPIYGDYLVAHVSVGASAGTSFSAKDVGKGNWTGGIYATPLSPEEDTAYSTGLHGHFQKTLTGVSKSQLEQQRRLFEQQINTGYEIKGIKLVDQTK